MAVRGQRTKQTAGHRKGTTAVWLILRLLTTGEHKLTQTDSVAGSQTQTNTNEISLIDRRAYGDSDFLSSVAVFQKSRDSTRDCQFGLLR